MSYNSFYVSQVPMLMHCGNTYFRSGVANSNLLTVKGILLHRWDRVLDVERLVLFTSFNLKLVEIRTCTFDRVSKTVTC